MADEGYIYVPASCAEATSTGCGVHVVLHGCEQTIAGMTFGPLAVLRLTSTRLRR